MDASHAVIWAESDSPAYVGALTVSAGGLQLRGQTGGDVAHREIGPDQITRVHIDRLSDRRLKGLPTLVLDLGRRDPIRIAAINGAGVLLEIADLAARLASEPRRSSKVVVFLPIRPDRRARVRELVQAGPPFDPAGLVGLERHQVFVTRAEVVFVFEGHGIEEAIDRLARSPTVWRAAVAWKDCLAGRPRVIEPDFAWTRTAGD
jgi:hypothetical protein